MTAIQIALPLGVALLTVVVNAFLNAKLRFAPDERTAFRELRGSAADVLFWLFNASNLFYLVRGVLSTEPLTRLAVFLMVLQVSVLTFAVTMRLLQRVVKVIDTMLKAQNEHLSLTDKVVDSVGHLAKTLKDTGPPTE